MTYRRRYLSGQAATTVVIAEGAITSDKIVDGAVTHPKVAADAIDSSKIADETIQSEDIKAGEVKTSDIGNGAVTTDKIADQAVTVDKLEASIQGIARPLTPGVSSDEIAAGAVVASKIGAEAVETAKIKDGNVNAAKLAADAVETVKIKDGAVSTAKIAGSAIDATKIAVNAVTGSEILNRSVGNLEIAVEGCHRENIKDLAINTVKLNPLAVTEAKLGAEAVTEPKLATAALAQRHVESKEIGILSHYEEFGGLHVSDKWQRSSSGGKGFGPNSIDGVHLLTGGVDGESHEINWGGESIDHVDILKPAMTAWIASRHASLTYLTNNIGLWRDANNYIIFQAEDLVGATPNWKARCKRLGTETVVDTGIPITTAIQVLTIDVVGGASVKFYIDGVEGAEVTTNIPITQELGPLLKVITRSAAVRWIKVKYVSILGNRQAYV